MSLAATRTSIRRTPGAGRRIAFLFLFVLVHLGATLASGQEPVPGGTLLLRYPDVHQREVVFSHAGDLWLTTTWGGAATRLTSHPGLELFPHFSPDGKTIAFTGQIDGGEQVYVVPSTGGEPRQLTFYPAKGPLPLRLGYDNQVCGFTPDGANVLFRSLRESWDLADSRLFTVPVPGGLPVPLPMRSAGAGDFSPDGRRIAFTPLARDFRHWKRYEGGWAQDIHLFDLRSGASRRLTDHPRTDRDPLFIGNAVVFVSDRSGTANLWRLDLGTEELRQLTFGETWDVRWPGTDGASRIVYELGGSLWQLDLLTEETRRIEVNVPTDGLATRPRAVSAGEHIEDFALSPRGDRVLLVGRGDVFTTTVSGKETRNLTRSDGAHDRAARWSPDGEWVAYVSDRSGEEQLYRRTADGRGQPEPLTRGLEERLEAPVFSPDGRRIAFGDKDGLLRVIDLETGTLALVADEERGTIDDAVWSPDGRYLAFSLTQPTLMRSIHLYSIDTRRTVRITSELTHEESPAWDPRGRFLYVIAERSPMVRIDRRDWNHLVEGSSVILAYGLTKGARESWPGPETSSPAGTPRIEVELEGLEERARVLPVPVGSYRRLVAVPGRLLFESVYPIRFDGGDMPESVAEAELRELDLQSLTVRVVSPDCDGYCVSQDGKKVLVRDPSALHVLELERHPVPRRRIDTRGMVVEIDPRNEWRQIFHEVWRRFRDYFFTRALNERDWSRLRDRYAALLPQVAHRVDLNDLIGEMIAELGVSHAYISGGDYEIPIHPGMALPGLRFELDAGAGRYRIASVLRGHNDEPGGRSPFREPMAEDVEGLYVISIEGTELVARDNPYRLLRNLSGSSVRMMVSQRPSAIGAREVAFEPLRDETELEYLSWVEGRMRLVAERSGGRVGYLHIPDMGEKGLVAFIRGLSGQLRHDALVVDVRSNSGGWLSSTMLERLRREVLFVRFGRTTGMETYPSRTFHGPLCCIVNERTASDGEVFAEAFRRSGLGRLVGRRTWGGTIGVMDRGKLLDGGTVLVPEFALTHLDGSLAIEGRGVQPDVEVENDPASLARGQDRQLERAVDLLLEELRTELHPLPERPTDSRVAPNGNQ